MTWRVLGPLVGAIAIVGVVVAILAPSNGKVLDPIAHAADTTAAAGSAEFGMSGSISMAGRQIPLNGSGALDMRTRHMRMSLAFPVPGFGSLEMDELFDGEAFYIHFPESLAGRLPGGKAWMKLDLAALGKSAGVDLQQMMQANQGNPADMLEALKGVGTSHKLGSENIGGAPTTHYRADIDLDKVADRVGGGNVKELFKSAGVSSVPVDVWIDRAGRVRREAFKFAAAGTAIDMTIEFTRFGVPVDVTPPPADQVMDAGALLGALGGRSG
jgi:hypothetical protein